MRWRSYRQSQLRPTSPRFKNVGWRLEPFDEVQANDISVSLWLVYPGSEGPDCLSSMPDRHARSLELRGIPINARGISGKAKRTVLNRFVVTERVYRLTHQHIIRVGRATGDSLFPVSDWQLQNGARAQDPPLTRSRTTSADILTGLETLNVRTNSKIIKILCNKSSRKNSN